MKCYEEQVWQKIQCGLYSHSRKSLPTIPSIRGWGEAGLRSQLNGYLKLQLFGCCRIVTLGFGLTT